MKLHTALLVGGTLAGAMLVACRDLTNPAPFHPTSALLNGTWVEENEVLGSHEEWTLSVTDTVITGTGGWAAEACCGGSLQILGYIHADSIVLAIKRSGSPFGSTDQPRPVVGTLIAQNEMSVSVVSADLTARPSFRMRKTP